MPGVEVMRGGQRARHLIHQHLQTYLNGRIGQLRALELDVPDVKEFHPAWRSMNRNEAWPIAMVTSHHGVIVERLDFVDGDPQYLWQWTVRSWFWARGESYEQTADRVELVAAAAQDVFLARPALGDPGDNARVIPDGMTVSLSDIERDPRTRASIAGAYVEAVVSMAETAPADPPLGTAETLTATAELLEEP